MVAPLILAAILLAIDDDDTKPVVKQPPVEKPVLNGSLIAVGCLVMLVIVGAIIRNVTPPPVTGPTTHQQSIFR